MSVLRNVSRKCLVPFQNFLIGFTLAIVLFILITPPRTSLVFTRQELILVGEEGLEEKSSVVEGKAEDLDRNVRIEEDGVNEDNEDKEMTDEEKSKMDEEFKDQVEEEKEGNTENKG